MAALALGLLGLAAFGLYQVLSLIVERLVQASLERNPVVVQRIIKDYITKNPDVMQQALTEMIKSRLPQLAGAQVQAKDGEDRSTAASRTAPDRAMAIKANAEQIFNSSKSGVIGNPQGDVTLVEFFDYNCGFCKRALADIEKLLSSDKKLRVVLKELPVLGPGSVEAARVSLAVRLQDQSGSIYGEFRKKLLASQGPITKDRALSVARELGLNVARIEADLAGDEVKASLEESRSLARTLGITGTPSYVIGEQVVPGAVGHAALAEGIRRARR